MSRLGCKTTLLDRIQRPGMIGALGVVSTASVQASASKWRADRGAPSPVMVKRIEAAVPHAERVLQTRAGYLANQQARCAVLRAHLKQVGHGGCKGARLTLREIAREAGMRHQLVINFRAKDCGLAETKLDALEAAMQRLGLMNGKGGPRA